jgi:hypothetical protein
MTESFENDSGADDSSSSSSSGSEKSAPLMVGGRRATRGINAVALGSTRNVLKRLNSRPGNADAESDQQSAYGHSESSPKKGATKTMVKQHSEALDAAMQNLKMMRRTRVGKAGILGGAHAIGKHRAARVSPSMNELGELNTPFGDGSTITEIEYLQQATKDPEIRQTYVWFKYAWKVIKGRTKHDFGTIQAAWEHYSTLPETTITGRIVERDADDECIRFPQFSQYLKDLDILLNPYMVRQLWDRSILLAKQCGIVGAESKYSDIEVDVKKQHRLTHEVFIFLHMNSIFDKMNERLKVVIVNFLRKRRRVQAVVALLLSASKANKLKALGRFHEKITHSFVDELRNDLVTRIQEDPMSILPVRFLI